MNFKSNKSDEITTTPTPKTRHGEDREKKKIRDRFENGFQCLYMILKFAGILKVVNFIPRFPHVANYLFSDLNTVVISNTKYFSTNNTLKSVLRIRFYNWQMNLEMIKS